MPHGVLDQVRQHLGQELWVPVYHRMPGDIEDEGLPGIFRRRREGFNHGVR